MIIGLDLDSKGHGANVGPIWGRQDEPYYLWRLWSVLFQKILDLYTAI